MSANLNGAQAMSAFAFSPTSDSCSERQSADPLVNARRQQLRIGRVVAVSASRIIALIESEPDSLDTGEPLTVGSLVKLNTATSTVYGMIHGLRVPLPTSLPADDLRVAEIDLVGEVVSGADEDGGSFQRGVSEFPTLEDAVYRASSADLARVYARPGPDAVPIGTVHPANAVPAYILADDLLGRHFSIVGTTGSGKSCAVVTILDSIISRNPNAHVVVLDPHSEYSRAFGEWASVLSPSSGLYLPYWLFNFDEIAEVIIGSSPHLPEQKGILSEAILRAKKPFFKSCGLEGVGTVDTPVPYRMPDVFSYLEAALGQLSRAESFAAYRGLQNRLAFLQNDPRYAFAFGKKLIVRDSMADILRQLFRIPVDGKPITILDLSEIPSEVLNVVVSVLCRLLFQFALWSETRFPITIVCEEAHRYAPRDESLGFEPAKRALSRIAKEGRRFGISLGVVSQRPCDLAAGLLSECNTMFALRMTNQDDQEIVDSALPEGSTSLMQFLPSLRDREAIAIGEGVSMPMRIRFNLLAEERRPRTVSASFTRAWASDCDGLEVDGAVERWRHGLRDRCVALNNGSRHVEDSPP